ncbi:hypothetical protein TSOC_005710, partial [Tetrabaena socialis]
EWKDLTHLSPRYKASLGALRSLARARLMSEHRELSERLDVDFLWDVAFILVQGRDPVRTAVYGLKWIFAEADLEPFMYKITEMDSKRTRLEVLLNAHFSPHRPWWLPVTWLLPKTMALQAVAEVRISKGAAEDGSEDVVTALDGRLANLGKLPTPIRFFNGVALGYLPAATEPLWSPLVGLFIDPSCRSQPAAEGEEEGGSLLGKAKEAVTGAAAAAAAAAERAQEAVVGAATGAAEATSAAADKAPSYAGATATQAAAAADEGAAMAGERGGMAAQAAGAVRHAVHEAAGAVKEGVEAGAARVGEAARRGKKAQQRPP